VNVLLSLNANYVRGSHYIQDERFLELCDENGILVWEEQLAWGNGPQDMLNKDFLDNEVSSLNSMISLAFNHPSVVLWGFFNEGCSEDPLCSPAYATMAKTIRDRDPSRLVTWASNRRELDINLHLADVVSFNNYPGWYEGNASSIVPSWQSDAAWVLQKWPTKPFLISEAGAGGIVGWLNGTDVRWSEQYEQLVDTLTATVAVNDTAIAGLTIWQFCDIKVDQPVNSTSRPGGLNNKGVVSQFLVPKLAAPAVAAVYASRPRY
jgi:beta-glucuronidase